MVYTEIVPDCKKQTLQMIILGKVSLESIIHSDSWRGYGGIPKNGMDKPLNKALKALCSKVQKKHPVPVFGEAAITLATAVAKHKNCMVLSCA